MIEITRTVSILEVVWTLMNIVGLMISARNLLMVIEDLYVLRSHTSFISEGPRHVIAKSRIRTEAIKTGLMVGFIVAGVMSMTVPPPMHHGPLNPAAITVTTIFILGAMAVIADSALYERDRDTIIDFYSHIPNDEQIKDQREDIRFGRTRKY